MATHTTEKCRLVTRSDFDGLVCAALFKELGILDEIKFVHPKDMQDGKVEVTSRDITTNVPYVAGVHLAFDHHLSETRFGDIVRYTRFLVKFTSQAVSLVFLNDGKSLSPSKPLDGPTDIADFSKRLNGMNADIQRLERGLNQTTCFSGNVADQECLRRITVPTIDDCRQVDVHDITIA